MEEVEEKNLIVAEDPLKDKWIDRDESWLQFNYRVLFQLTREDLPIVNRLSFIGIADSNLTEFVSVRYAGHYNDDQEDPHYVKNLRTLIVNQKVSILKAFENANRNFHLVDYPPEKESVKKIFLKKVYPILTPIAVGPNKEVPALNERDLNFFVQVRFNDEDEDPRYVFLQIPYQVNRFIKSGDKIYLIEDIIEKYMDDIFNTCTVEQFIQFTVTKDFSEEIQPNPEIPVLQRIQEVLLKRRENHILFLDIMKYNEDSSEIIKRLTKVLNVAKKNVFIATKSPFNMIGAHSVQSYQNGKFDKKISLGEFNKSFKPKFPEELLNESSILGYLEDHDLLIQHPYERYDVVVNFLRESAQDPKVISIKQTLYRVSSEKSPIVKALCQAARNGIKVTVMLELLARFDERRNISLINQLKESGVNIVYTLDGYKTHCKMCLVVKATKKGIKIFSHVGTGNYNERTAKIYTDVSYFTSRSSIGSDLNQIFNMISGISRPEGLTKIRYSPDSLRPCIEENIQWVANADKDFTRKIYMKVNSISDHEIVQQILSISELHPEIEFHIICRGICSLPFRENIKIHSIVGRFLEHSRIYMFQVGNEVRTFISSADLLTRNLDRRVETLIEVEEERSKRKLQEIFSKLWEDTANTFILSEDNSWKYLYKEDIPYINAQNEMTK